MDTDQAFIQETTLPCSAMAASGFKGLDRILPPFQDAAALHAVFHDNTGAKLAIPPNNWKKSSHGHV